MARFYFHVHDDIVTEDLEGAELPDLAAARETALEAARDLVCAAVMRGELNLDHRIEVAGEGGENLLTVTFRDAFTIRQD
jgi:hypothetical protein